MENIRLSKKALITAWNNLKFYRIDKFGSSEAEEYYWNEIENIAKEMAILILKERGEKIRKEEDEMILKNAIEWE